MVTNYLFILLAVAILVLPATVDLIERDRRKKWYKRITPWGITFYIAVFMGTVLQFTQERQRVNNEIILTRQIDSLTVISKNSSDTIRGLKSAISGLQLVLHSIDNKSSLIEEQMSITFEKLADLGKTSDSLNKVLLEADRPVVILSTARIASDNSNKQKHVDFIFVNRGKRAATNFSGKVYGIKNNSVFKHAGLPFTTTEILAPGQSYSSHMNLMFNINPDSTSIDDPIYYFHEMAYSDLITGTKYNAEFLVKLEPFKKGEYKTSLIFCSPWELVNVKNTVEQLYYNLKHQLI